MRIHALAIAVILCALSGLVSGASTEFTYQGQLKTGGAPSNGLFNLQFELFDAVTMGNQISGLVTFNNVTVTNGLFTVALDFGVKAFSGPDRWLEVSVQGPGDPGFTTLTPRQKLTATPYALALPNLRTEASQNTPMFLSANVIGGADVNTVGPGVSGAVIAGGGATNGFPQTVNAFYASILGGFSNTVTVNGSQSTIAGGTGNVASSSLVAIGGGQSNTGGANGATVAGGISNTASGSSSMVPGGNSNTAAGSTALAAGNRAKALNNGSFVWGDSTSADVASTANDQFVIRANGGVVVNTAANVALNASNGVTLGLNATNAVSVPVGSVYRDNTVVAWGRVAGNGVLQDGFNILSVVRNSAGNYMVTMNTPFTGTALLPVVSVSYIGAQPTTAASIRFAATDQLLSNTAFSVYINNGLFAAADADFTFIVTGR